MTSKAVARVHCACLRSALSTLFASFFWFRVFPGTDDCFLSPVRLVLGFFSLVSLLFARLKEAAR